MERPISNPPNPYVGPLRVFPGTLVKINGRARPNATRFAINLQTGPSLNPRDDLALHLSPCFTPPRIVRNSLRQGAWGLEEAWGNGTVLNPHQPFEIMILTTPDQFNIAINGAHYCEFKHRMPYPEISHLTIDGDVDIDYITVTSMPAAPQPTAGAYNPYSAGPVPMPSVPSGGPMPMPSMPGMAPMAPMPTPSAYQTNMYPSNPYSAPGAYPPGPTPTGAAYSAGSTNPYPAQPNPYSSHMPGGPAPTGAGYQSGYPVSPLQNLQEWVRGASKIFMPR